MSKKNSKSRTNKSKRDIPYWKITLLVLFGTFLACLIVIALFRLNAYEAESNNCVRLQKEGACVLSLEYASSRTQKMIGLGNRVSMPEDHAMVFPYDTPQAQCFWMKDMKFSLDMIWLDANKQVVHVEPNVSPETYPKTYCPPVDAQYVIEVNAGTASKLGLEHKQQLYF